MSLEFLMVARSWSTRETDFSAWPLSPAEVERGTVKKRGTARLGVGKAEVEVVTDWANRPYYVVKMRARVDDAGKLRDASMDEAGIESTSMPKMLMSVLVEPAWKKSGFEERGFRMEWDGLEAGDADAAEFAALMEMGKLAMSAGGAAAPSRKRKI